MNIQEKAMLANLSVCMFSPNKTDKKASKKVCEENNAGDGAAKVSKVIIPKESLDGIRKVSEEARDYHYKHTLPWSDEGPRILPSKDYLEYTQKMRSFAASFDQAVDEFCKAYEGYVDAARARLNGLFNSKDYPDRHRIKKKFKFKTDFLPLAAGSDFRVDLAEEELAVLRDQYDTQVRARILAELQVPIKAMVERLSDPTAVFRNTLVSNVQDILKLMPAGDPAIERLRQMAQELTLHDPEVLRQSASTRREVAAKANDILATMSGYLPDESSAAPPMELPPEPEIVEPPAPFVPELPPVVPQPAPIVAPVAPPRSWRRAISSVAVTANLP